MGQFWILALISLGLCLIGAAIDYTNAAQEKKSQSNLLIGWGIIFGASLLAAWGINSLPVTLILGAALAGFIYTGRYLMRKFANRKL